MIADAFGFLYGQRLVGEVDARTARGKMVRGAVLAEPVAACLSRYRTRWLLELAVETCHFAGRLLALLPMTGHLLSSKAKSRFPTVAQTVDFGRTKLKMLYFSMGVD